MKGRRLAALGFAAVAALLLGGCGDSGHYADGTYTAQSELFEGIEDEEFGAEGDGYGVVTITLRDNRVVACEFTTYTTDGAVKDGDYGKRGGEITNQDYYNKAQRAVRASQNYAEQLAAKGSLDAVDAISGATISYQEFQEAVKAALKQAK